MVPIFRLKELRQQRRISQIKLAMDLDTTQNTISRYENEIREADYRMLIRFADYFDVSIDYLLGRTENPGAQPVIAGPRLRVTTRAPQPMGWGALVVTRRRLGRGCFCWLLQDGLADGGFPSPAALGSLHQLHQGDHAGGQGQGDGIFSQADVGEAKGIRQEGHIQHRRGADQRG